MDGDMTGPSSGDVASVGGGGTTRTRAPAAGLSAQAGESWGQPTAGTKSAERPGSEPRSHVLRVPPELRSVGQARAKLSELARSWGLAPVLSDDARVVLGELMSNGVLHARTELQVVVTHLGDGLRLEVHDASSLPVVPPLAAGAGTEPFPGARGAEAGADVMGAPAATGRGLAMVNALARAWGWFPDASGGKVVWAELGPPAAGPGTTGSSPGRSEHTLRPVRLIAVPVRLVKASEDHFDDLFRELQMAQLAGGGEPAPAWGEPAGGGERTTVAELALRAEHVRARLARMREPVRRSIWEAARRGDRLIDLNLLADAAMPAVFESCEQLLRSASGAARRGYLLTEPPGPEVVAWRRWLRGELEAQIAGKPPQACPFPVTPWADEPVGATVEAQDVARRQALAGLRSVLAAGALTGGSSPAVPGMADDVVMVGALGRAAELVGARRAALCLLGEDNESVRFGASYGFSSDVAEYWQVTSLSADLPSSEAIRTNRPLLFRTLAELDARYPVFGSTPAESDPAVACLPLSGQSGSAIGCLVLGFAQARDFSHREVAFLEDVAQDIATSLRDRRDRAQKEAAARLTAQLEAAAALISACATKEDVLRELVEAVVGCLCDGAAVHLVDGPEAVRYFISRHRDPERLAAVVALLQKRQYHAGAGRDGDLIFECVRTGQTSVLQMLSDDVISAGAVDDEDLALLRRASLGAVGVMPVGTEKSTLAVLSFANNVGRFISEEDLAALGHLTSTAGKALTRLGF